MIYDTLIVGAGPAGLTAATYLGRFRRQALVLDGGEPRAGWIPESHNTPGFPRGVGGPELLTRMREQAERYGAAFRKARAEILSREGDLFVVDLAGAPGESVRGRTVLLATGVVDIKPTLGGIEAAIRRALVRMCPICDAYEAIDQAIAVLGDGPLGAREAMFLRTYSERVTLLHLGAMEDLDLAALRDAGIGVAATSLKDITLEEKVIVGPVGTGSTFDCLYLALGCEMQSRLAVRWGAEHDAEANLIVDAHQRTSIDGLYAAGDVVRGLNQIAIATAEAAIAATDIHRRLRQIDHPPRA